jgi:16S rRNA (cytosine967-C5)-methyltransferase
MTPGARIKAVIDVLEIILSAKSPADQQITNYFRNHRYIGSTDRRAIAERTYQVLRQFQHLNWLSQTLTKQDDAPTHLLVALHLRYHANFSLLDIDQIFNGTQYHPECLNKRELYLIKTDISELSPPIWAQLNLPEWLMPFFEENFPQSLESELAALNEAAPLDLRVNCLKIDRREVLEQLSFEAITASPTPWSPFGIRLPQRRPLPTHPLWQDGFIEVQDEGSQLIALLSDARPGMNVVDFCAGAGGKTLAMAATMNNQGKIICMDTIEWRLKRAKERFRRAGIHNAECRTLDEAGYKWLKRQSVRFDRVLVDAPCSGTGTWRRNPDLKLRFSQNDLDELVQKQADILDTASKLVKPFGRLIYATCSVLKNENDLQINHFLETHPDFELIPIQQVWNELFDIDCPVKGNTLQLTPAQHQVDGFFCAVMMKRENKIEEDTFHE